jgi:hypothetical protein
MPLGAVCITFILTLSKEIFIISKGCQKLPPTL